MFALPTLPVLTVERVFDKANNRPLFLCTYFPEDGGSCIVHDSHSFADTLAAAREWRSDGVPTLWIGEVH